MSPTRCGGPAPSGFTDCGATADAAGAVVGGITADLWGLRAAIWAATAITVASGLAVALRMYETHPAGARTDISK